MGYTVVEMTPPQFDPELWFQERTSRWGDWDVERLVALKGTSRISVVIPAKDEEATVGPIVSGIRDRLMVRHPLVDELVVIDSDSIDDTSNVALAAGAMVYKAADIRPDMGIQTGKGEALWKSQFVTDGDILVFIDADLTGWDTHFVLGLVGPLLSEPDVQLVKGFYDRVLESGTGETSTEGGRVTELVARPVLNLYWPDLSRVIQPLAGEWALRRSAFADMKVPTGYGIELAALLDVYAEYGLTGLAQVDLGERSHVHQSVHDLGLMAAELIALAFRRAKTDEQPPSLELWQYRRSHGWYSRNVPHAERPPGAWSGPARN